MNKSEPNARRDRPGVRSEQHIGGKNGRASAEQRDEQTLAKST